MERLVLADGDSGSEWVPAEATMDPDDRHARQGRAMHFHVDVNFETGQPDYPIGWPRTYLRVTEAQRDWTGWDFVDFWLYAETSRESFPSTALGFIVRCPDRNNQWQTTLEPKKGEWVHYRFPVSNVPDPTNVHAVQLFISEANYAHGDVLDFWIDELALLRYAEPTIVAVRPLNQVAYADADVLRVRVKLTGMDEGEAVEVLTRLVDDGETLRQSATTLGDGTHTMPLQVGGRLEPGEYEVQAQIVGSDRTLSETIRMVSSPWEGDAQ
ncbi:MAG: hypothetical protein ACP5KN_07505, partial [Armatimonadota bacterium]